MKSEFFRIPQIKLSLLDRNHNYSMLSHSGAKSVPQMVTWGSNLDLGENMGAGDQPGGLKFQTTSQRTLDK